ncbi:nitroreductase [Hyphomonas oceanitis]|uniref:nitroreductase family protein n=1 Tax=Hyphomonas oceanitis TaxID=81033 RepID=UPI0030038F65
MLATRPSADARAMLALRRSVGKQFLTEPGPSPSDLDELLTIAARVPDHRKLNPWRFIAFEGDARVEFGKAIAKIHGSNLPDAESQDVLHAAGLPLRAPVMVAVISSPDHTHKTPVWEQELSAGAVCHNLLLAANASGWAGVWLTEWLAFDKQVDAVLGLTEGERVAGYIYLGTATMASLERPRADMSEKVTRWTGLPDQPRPR